MDCLGIEDDALNSFGWESSIFRSQTHLRGVE